PVICAFTLLADPSRRLVVVRHVLLPLLVALAVYHGWRIWYFGDPLSTPLYAKVMYKFLPNAQRVVKTPERAYVLRLVDVYGWPAAITAAAMALMAAWHSRSVRTMVLALAVPLIYVSVVSDWMFGFRFFVPLLPLAAVVIGMSISVLF